MLLSVTKKLALDLGAPRRFVKGLSLFGQLAEASGCYTFAVGDLEVRALPRISMVDPARWDALDHGHSPFLRHGFLLALEASGSVGEGTGWLPVYLVAEAVLGGARELVGAVAAYVKTDSYGEYIFDWAWANAAERAGLCYYPKLTISAPFSPVTGRRLLLRPDVPQGEIAGALVDAAEEAAVGFGCSSIHWLFCAKDERDELAHRGYAPRSSFQFHWHNRGYSSFDDFLAQLRSRKRKQIRRERARALEAISSVDMVPGADLQPEDTVAMDRYYRSTVFSHGGFDYLRPGFFRELCRRCPEGVLFARARRRGETVAGALFLESDSGLYGRYWGADENVDLLHFELAYYAGIERCIAQKTPLFEAGAQGEHKLLRGFEPSPTYSAHRLFHPGLDRAVRGFLAEEACAVAARMAALAGYGPYRKD